MILVRRKIYDFRGAVAPPAVASRIGEWCSKLTAAAGSPTVKAVNGGTMDLALEATNEVQNACLYQGDILPWQVQNIERVWVNVKSTSALDASITATFGLIAARNDTPGSSAAFAYFQAAGSNALNVRTYDGVTNSGLVSTGLSLTTTLSRFCIDMRGVRTQQLPSQSLGNRANVSFFEDNANGVLRQVGKGTLFGLSGYAGTSCLQLFAQIQKTAAAVVGTLSVESFEVEFKVR